MYIRLINDTPIHYTIDQLRRDYPQTSFPDKIPDTLLAEYDVYPVTSLPIPPRNPQTHYLKQSDFYQVDGQWRVHYTSEPLPESQVADTMRSKRNQLLAETDWVIVVSYEQESIVPDSWKQYRQTLRDITAQPGFPYEIEWPEKPSVV